MAANRAGGYFTLEELEAIRQDAQQMSPEERYFLVREELFPAGTARHPLCGPRPGDERAFRDGRAPWDLLGIRWGVARILAFGCHPDQVLGCDGPSKVDSKYPPSAAADGWRGPRRDPDLRPLCPSCGLPVHAEDGKTRQTKTNVDPRHGCDECGWRYPRTRVPGFVQGIDPDGKWIVASDAEGKAAGAHLREIVRARSPEERAAISSMGGRAREGSMKSRASHLLDVRAEEFAERVVAPFFRGLELEPNEDWSSSTKLRFFGEQAALAEKILNRVDGMPTVRTRDETREEAGAAPEAVDLSQVPGSVVVEALAGVLEAGSRAGYEFSRIEGSGDRSSEGAAIEGRAR